MSATPITVQVLLHRANPLIQHSNLGFLLLIGPETPTGSTSVPGKLRFGSIPREQTSTTTALAYRRRILSAERSANRPNGPTSTLELIGRSHSKARRVSFEIRSEIKEASGYFLTKSRDATSAVTTGGTMTSNKSHTISSKPHLASKISALLSATIRAIGCKPFRTQFTCNVYEKDYIVKTASSQ